jgi:hypothetical protein
VRRIITNTGADSEFAAVLASARRSLWRWEQQPEYFIGTDRELLEDFVAGRPRPATEIPDLRGWFDRVKRMSAAGVSVGRVRVVDEPATDYQRWLQFVDPYNREAGEVIDYLSRGRLREIGPSPFDPDCDWWLVDDEQLLVIGYDEIFRPAATELVTEEPEISMAKSWRELVVGEARKASRA